MFFFCTVVVFSVVVEARIKHAGDLREIRESGPCNNEKYAPFSKSSVTGNVFLEFWGDLSSPGTAPPDAN